VPLTPADPPPPAPSVDEISLRAIIVAAKRRTNPRLLLRALLQASEDLTLCSTVAWERRRAQGTTAEKLHVELDRTLFLLAQANDRAEILAARLARIDPRHRPHYSPPLRYRILQHMRTYLLAVEETAAAFLVTGQTVYNWKHEVETTPDKTTIGSTVSPMPPVRRFATAVRELVRQMNAAGFGGKRNIAQNLLRNGWSVSARTVRRMIKERPKPQRPPAPMRPTTVRGDHPNHLWLMDITAIPTLFPFLKLSLVTVLDACSRLPLASTLRLAVPSAAVVTSLLDRAIRTHGRPKHLVVDRGAQFTDRGFKEFVERQSIKMRHGAVGQTHSLGLIDRFFRTVKDTLSLLPLRPWCRKDIERKLQLVLLHYSYLRPHTSLGGFTPIEVYYGIRGHLPRPVSPPRGRPADPQPEAPFEIAYLDPEHLTFPILVPKAA
jgi:transposase InsO family protein